MIDEINDMLWLKRLIYLLTLVMSLVLAFFDLSNHLNIGTPDKDGFYPTNHGLFGNTLKVAFIIFGLYALIKLIHSFIRNKIIVVIVAIISAVALVVGASVLAFDLYFTF